MKPGLPEHEAGKINRLNAVQSARKFLMFRRNLKPETSFSKKIYFFYLEERGSLLLRNIGTSLPDYMAAHTGRRTVLRGVIAGFPQRRFRVRSCGICDGERGNAAGFLRALRFPLTNSFSTEFSMFINNPQRGQINDLRQNYILFYAMRISNLTYYIL